LFTGLVETTAPLVSFTDQPTGRRLEIAAPAFAHEIRPGDSIAVNGCCLTVAEKPQQTLTFDLLEETLRRTNLGALAIGQRVNLERALAANARLGGHFVQGHIDCTTTVIEVNATGADLGLTFALPKEFAHYVIAKGSIAINGVSLTVANLFDESFCVWLIPTTRRETNLGDLRAGDAVNVEFDLIAKYTERLSRH